MTEEPRYWAVVLIGPPGSGKNTQADLLAEQLGLVHLVTSKIIEEKFKNSDPNDEVLAREAENKKKGILVNQTMVASWLIDEVEKQARDHKGVVLSGSPRSLEELEGLLPVLEELYGKENIRVIDIQLSQEEAVKRNTGRRTCQAQGHPFSNSPEFQSLTTCPIDGSPLIVRDDDNPEVTAKRYKVYMETTAPALDHFKKHGYSVVVINGEQGVEAVHQEIMDKIW